MRFPKRLLILFLFATSLTAQSFETASIRINKNDQSGAAGKRISIETSPSSLIMRNVTLLSCLRWANDVRDYQITGGPDWRNSDRFDIVAKPPAAASDDQLKLMLRSLLVDRFKLALTRETKELPAYVITVDKNGHRLKPSTGEGQRGMRPAEGGLEFHNASMADLEQFLNTVLAGDKPVFDKTSLMGRYDFTLILFNDAIKGGADGIKGAIADAGGVAYSDALKRLGLKMESQKVPLETLTIDHVERPSEN